MAVNANLSIIIIDTLMGSNSASVVSQQIVASVGNAAMIGKYGSGCRSR